MVSAGDLLENFIEETKPFKCYICIKFYAKRRDYGLKLYVVVRSAATYSTIINTFMKLRSSVQLGILQCTLKSIKASILHHINNICQPDSGTQVVTLQ